MSHLVRHKVNLTLRTTSFRSQTHFFCADGHKVYCQTPHPCSLERMSRGTGHQLQFQLAPRGLVASDATTYLGLKTEAKFRALVRAGQLPQPLPWGKPQTWDRRALDLAVDRLSSLENGKPAAPKNGQAEAIRRVHERANTIRHKAPQ